MHIYGYVYYTHTYTDIYIHNARTLENLYATDPTNRLKEKNH